MQWVSAVGRQSGGAKGARRVACRVPANPNGIAVLRDNGSKYILITFFLKKSLCVQMDIFILVKNRETTDFNCGNCLRDNKHR